MNEREELQALRRMAELEAKERAQTRKTTPANYNQEVTSEMSGMQKFGAGMGKGFVDVWNGLRQVGAKVGIGDEKKIQKVIDDLKEESAPLMDTGAGMFGNVAGTAAAALPAVFIPGANTYVGAGLASAGIGALQPVASDESRLENTLLAGVGGVGGQAAGRVVAAGAKGAKALVEPFYQKGRDAIVGRTLNRFAEGSANDVIAAAQNPKAYIPGSSPTLAEVAQHPGISGFQLAAKNSMPEVKTALGKREAENAAARVSALREIAGDDGKLDFFKTNREDVAKTMYQNAFDEQVADSPWVKGQLTQLMKRPAFRSALKDAQTLALNKGVKLNPKNAVEVAHYTKLALDDQIANATGNQRAALTGIKEQLLTTMESKSFSPSYGAARKTYADMSKPINQMEIGQDLLNKLQPALMDFSEGAITRSKAESYAQALRNAEQTAKRATGFPAKALEQVMTPEQMASLTGVAKDLARKATSEDMAKTVGSTTAQNLASQNILRQTMGPFGLPQSWAESTLMQTAARPAQFAYSKIAEPRIEEVLAQALMDPKLAAKLMQGQTKNPALQRALIQSLLSDGSTAAGTGLALSQGK